MKTNKLLSNYFNVTSNFLNKKLPQEDLYKPISYIFNLGGKQVRPFFLIYSYKIFGGKEKKINKVALALECLHNFSLIHDDVMDNAEKRRGKLTVQKKWNQNTAILSGDALLILCFKILNSINSNKKHQIINEFTEASLKICEGQQIDLQMEGLSIISKDEYFEMIKLKTAALFMFCFKMGCYLAGGDRKNQILMKDIGLKIGLLFQIQDDYLDFFGTKKVGKKIGQDVLENKKTFLFCEFINHANDKDKKEFIFNYNKKKSEPTEKIKYVKSIFKNYDIKNKTLNEINILTSSIVSLISKLSITKKNKEEFSKYINELSSRTN